jgi:hypothetical protein
MVLTKAESARRYRKNHPERYRESVKKYHQSEKGREYLKRYYKNNIIKIRAYRKIYRAEHSDIIRKRIKDYYYSEKGQEKAKQTHINVRNKIFNHYSSDGIKCALCGITDCDVLSIDHINGDGGKHRKEIGRSGHSLYVWLIKQGFPEGYRVLCLNCQHKEALRLRLFTGNKINHHRKYPTTAHSKDLYPTDIQPVSLASIPSPLPKH